MKKTYDKTGENKRKFYIFHLMGGKIVTGDILMETEDGLLIKKYHRPESEAIKIKNRDIVEREYDYVN